MQKECKRILQVQVLYHLETLECIHNLEMKTISFQLEYCQHVSKRTRKRKREEITKPELGSSSSMTEEIGDGRFPTVGGGTETCCFCCASSSSFIISVRRSSNSSSLGTPDISGCFVASLRVFEL